MAYNFQQFGQHQQYYQQHNPHYAQQSTHYGNYGNFFSQSAFTLNAWQAYNMREEQELANIFGHYVSMSEANSVSNGIQCEDLCNILNKTPSIRNYYGISWNRELCSILMAMLDRNPDGFMQWPEFLELQRCLLAWHNMFRQCDIDGSGYIEAVELAGVINKFDAFRKRDQMTNGGRETGQCVFNYDDFLRCVMCL